MGSKPKRGKGPLVEVSWVAAEAGVSRTAFAKWRRAAGYKSIRQEERNFVSWEAATAYLNGAGKFGVPRVDSPPNGWLTVKQIVERTGLPRETVRNAATLRPGQVCKVKGTMYYEPGPVIELAKRRAPQPIPAGWIPIRRIAEQVGLKPNTVRLAVHRNKMDRIYLRIRDGHARKEMLVRTEDARKLLVKLRRVENIQQDEISVKDWVAMLGQDNKRRGYYYITKVAEIELFLRSLPNKRWGLAFKRSQLVWLTKEFESWRERRARVRKEAS